MVGVIVVTFLIARVVPGDPAVAYAGPRATPRQLDAVRRAVRARQAGGGSSATT